MVHLSLQASSKEDYSTHGVIFLDACPEGQMYHAWKFHVKVPMNTYSKGTYSLELLRGSSMHGIFVPSGKQQWRLQSTMLWSNHPCCLPAKTNSMHGSSTQKSQRIYTFTHGVLDQRKADIKIFDMLPEFQSFLYTPSFVRTYLKNEFLSFFCGCFPSCSNKFLHADARRMHAAYSKVYT